MSYTESIGCLTIFQDALQVVVLQSFSVTKEADTHTLRVDGNLRTALTEGVERFKIPTNKKDRGYSAMIRMAVERLMATGDEVGALTESERKLILSARRVRRTNPALDSILTVAAALVGDDPGATELARGFLRLLGELQGHPVSVDRQGLVAQTPRSGERERPTLQVAEKKAKYGAKGKR